MPSIEQLRTYLKAGCFVDDQSVDMGLWNRVALEILEQAGENPLGRRLEQLWFSRRPIERLVPAMLETAGHTFGVVGEEREKTVRDALRVAAGLEESNLSPVRLRRLQQLYHACVDPEQLYLLHQYCREIHLVDRSQIGVLGNAFLHLTGRESVRWLLAVEACQSLGEWDTWRIDLKTAEWVLQTQSEKKRYDNEILRLHPIVLERLCSWSMATYLCDDLDGEKLGWQLLDLGTLLLTELIENKNPYVPLIQSILSDEMGTTVGRITGRPIDTGATEATVRQYRLIAHELRNSLLPVQHNWQRVWKHLEGTETGVELEKEKNRIEAGLQQALDFATQTARSANLLPGVGQSFAISSAIQDAIASYSVHFERITDHDLVLGQRERFVLVIVNLLRNALQAKPEAALRVAVSRSGSRVQVLVDDDGPGVPEELRRRIFDNGITLRPDGTGHGLALARQVVEVEMRGLINCSSSPHGGARFIILLPAAGA